MKTYSIIAVLALAGVLTTSAADKGAEALTKRNAAPAPAKQESNVDGKLSILSSHIKSIGTIGKTDRYTIVSARVRGLDSPNLSALLAYDAETDSLAVLASGVEPGLGVAIVNGGASVGGSYLFGSKIRPDRTNVSNNSASEGSSAKSVSEGGEATSVSLSEGGDSNAVSVSDADATARSSSSSSATAVNSNTNTNSNTNSRKNGNGPKDKN